MPFDTVGTADLLPRAFSSSSVSSTDKPEASSDEAQAFDAVVQRLRAALPARASASPRALETPDRDVRRPVRRAAVPRLPVTEEEQIYDRRAQFKVKTSRVAMHLETAWRDGLFRQLDTMLDEDVWDFSEALPSEESFTTLLRLIVYLGHVARPGLGATATGNIIAMWTNGKDRLTVECQPGDRLRWVITRYLTDEPVRSAGTCRIGFLPAVLAPFKPEIWFAT